MGGIGGLNNLLQEMSPTSWVSPVMPFNSQDQQYNQNLGIIDQATQNAFNGQYDTNTYTDQNGIQHTTYSANGNNYNVWINQNGDQCVQITTPAPPNDFGTGPSTTSYTLDQNGNMQVQQDNIGFGGRQNETTTDFQREAPGGCGGYGGYGDPWGQNPYDQVNEFSYSNPPFWENPQPPGFINYPLPGQSQPGGLHTMMMSAGLPGGGTDDG